MAPGIKSIISFGMVAIPIEMYIAKQDNDIHFNLLHKVDHSRIKYKKVCVQCGDELEGDDIVKGYKYDIDSYVVITNEELEKIKKEKEKSIEILSFVKLDEISPVHYEKSYQTVPQFGSEKAFELLRTALIEESKIAIGKSVLGTKETLMALIPRKEGILILTMCFANEIKKFQNKYDKPTIPKPELDLARILINTMDIPFEPDQYSDKYQTKLHELIVNKILGNELVVAVEKKHESGKAIDLMEALNASIRKAKIDKNKREFLDYKTNK